MKITIERVSKVKQWKTGEGIGFYAAGEWYNCRVTDFVKTLQAGDTVEVEVKNGFINQETIKKVEPDKSYTEGIEDRHEDRQDGMALGNAKNCAANIVCALINSGKIADPEKVEEYLCKYTNYIYNLKPGELPFS